MLLDHCHGSVFGFMASPRNQFGCDKLGAALWVLQVLEALRFLHPHGVVHR